jgi:hypothetical protein
MGRILFLILVVGFVLSLAVITGFTFLEGVIILVLGIFCLGFLAWIIQGFRPNLIRCILFWWIAMLLNKHELLYPD